MTRFRVILVLLFILGGAQSQSGYWWMGQDGSFGSSSDNVETVNEDNNSAAGYGYGPPASSNNQPVDLQGDASELLINNDINERDSGYISPFSDLPATECSIGWKCVSELFCDETATMVQTRVNLTPEQKRRRGQLIVSIYQLHTLRNKCNRIAI